MDAVRPLRSRVGVNPIASLYAGIDVARTKFFVFCISGAVAGLVGYLWISRYVIASVEVASGYELTVIAACLVGGVSIAGGVGSVAGAVLGALFLGIIADALPCDPCVAILADGDLRRRHHRCGGAQPAQRAATRADHSQADRAT